MCDCSIEEHNSNLKNTWKARKYDFLDFANKEDARHRLGVPDAFVQTMENLASSGSLEYSVERSSEAPLLHLPSTFDARKTWPKCSSIAHIADQGNQEL